MQRSVLYHFACLLFFLFSSLICLAQPRLSLSSCLDEQNFAQHWTIESESPDFRLHFLHDTLELISPKGMTLWRNEKMSGHTVVEYDACLMDEGLEGDRPSDLNCFWMASDPGAGGSVFTRLKQRQGIFKRCYSLQLYYLGYGGNSNSTTRFRRYHAEAPDPLLADFPSGQKASYPIPPILKEYKDAAHLNVANRWRHIRVEAEGMRIRYYIDGECIVDYRDPQPLTEGWFGLRTTWSRLRVTNFHCHTEPLTEDPASGITLRWIERPLTDTLAVRFGVPFERGKVTNHDHFMIAKNAKGSANAEGIKTELTPLAYWPDGSIKWGGFSAILSNAETYTLRQLSSTELKALTRQGKREVKKTINDIQVEANPYQYIVRNGSSTLYLSRRCGQQSLLDSLCYDGAVSCNRLRLSTDDQDAILDSLLIEKQGTREVVFKYHAHLNGLQFILRLYVTAGTPALKLIHTLIYNRRPEEAAPQSLALRADVPLTGQLYNRHVAFTTDGGSIWHEPVQPVTGRRNLSFSGNGRGNDSLYREQMLGHCLPDPEAFDDYNRGLLSHWASWDRFRLSQPLDEGFSIRKSAKPSPQTPWIGTLSGRRSTGGCFVGDVQHGLAMAMQDFWQSYPSTLLIEGATQTQATVSLYLWSPEAESMDLKHYDTEAHDLEAAYEDIQEGMSTPEGIGRTTTMILQPTTGYPGDKPLAQLLDALTRQPQLICTPEYLHAQRAFGIWSLPDTLYCETEAQLTHWANFIVHEVEHRHWYGFWNYGDVMHAFDPVRDEWRYDIGGFAWDNTELASNMMLWYNFLRTGRADLWQLAVAMTRHTSEVDVYHDGPFKGLGSRHNVSHWGCGSKEARISQAAWNRFYYYLSGGDERLGELMTAQRDLDTLLYRIDPMRLAEPRGLYPCTAPARLRIGPDWIAYAANWMTEYERTLNPHYWQKILNGMESISQLPQGMFSGPKALGYDPASGRISWEGDASIHDTNHLLPLMGGFEVMNELLLTSEVPQSWHQTWLHFCTEYRQRAIQLKKNGYAIGRLPAFAYWKSGSPELYKDAMIEWTRGQQTDTSFSTNGISTWSLDAIFMLEVCPPPLGTK